MTDENPNRKKPYGPKIQDPSVLVQFLYLLMRDHLPTGTIQKIVNESMDSLDRGPVSLTNGYLASYGEHIAWLLSSDGVPREDDIAPGPYHQLDGEMGMFVEVPVPRAWKRQLVKLGFPPSAERFCWLRSEPCTWRAVRSAVLNQYPEGLGARSRKPEPPPRPSSPRPNLRSDGGPVD